jgi:hypothetical protein
MSEQTIYRVSKDKKTPYVVINKEFLSNPNLSWKAKGILAYMLSLPDDWQIYETEIMKHSIDGRSSTSAGIKELIKAGYIERTQNKTEKGKFSGYKYTVYESLNRVRFSDNGFSDNGFSNTTNNYIKPSNNETKKELHPTLWNGISDDCFIDVKNKINKYCLEKFGRELRPLKKDVYDIECYKDLHYEEIEEFLDKVIDNYNQCNMEYITAIQYRMNQNKYSV